MPPPANRTECGLGCLRSEIGNGNLLRLVDTAQPIVHTEWTLLAAWYGIEANTYWIFLHPIGGETYTTATREWSITIPAGSPPTWIGEGYDDLVQADDRFVVLCDSSLGLTVSQRMFRVEE